jgi:protein SCO1/2
MKTMKANRIAMLPGCVFRSTGGCNWRFLTTRGNEDLRPRLPAYDQTVGRKANLEDPLASYYLPVRVHLIDASGPARNGYSVGMLDPRVLVTDVPTLERESTTTAAK